MRKVSILICLFLLCAMGLAQNAIPNVDLTNTPTITFTQTWREAMPPFYRVTVAETGSASYQSTAKPDNVGDPYELKFTVSPATLAKLFKLADGLNHFNGDWDFKKSKIAFTGTKVLSFKNGDQAFNTTFNWSDNVQVQQVTAIFQNISQTIEMGRKLADTYRFDKLGVDAVLKSMEEEAKNDRLAEIQAIQPILTKIANDPAMMNISRRRAEFLLTKIPKGAAVAGQS